jgi:hypothetical protein
MFVDLAWFLEHFHKQSEEISMLQRFFSLAELTVRLHWPLNAKVYLHFSGEMQGLHGKRMHSSLILFVLV